MFCAVFKELNCATKVKLFKSYCSSIFGSELWPLDDPGVDMFCVTWRKGLRRVMCLPPATHCYLLPLLSDTLPIFDEICKRSMRFVLSCLFSRSSLVRSITHHGIAAGYDSVIGRNVLLCCKLFNWSPAEFTHGTISLCKSYFWHRFVDNLTDAQRQSELFMHELFDLRDHSCILTNNMILLKSEIDSFVTYVCTS